MKKQKSSSETNPQIKSSRLTKSKNKQMFAQLKTHQQNKINNTHILHNFAHQDNLNEDEQNSYEIKQELSLTKQNKNIEQICEIVHNLIIKNKLNIKNAFDVPFIDLERLEEFQKIDELQNGWKKISSTLENDSKIYSLRVDAIHSIAYKIMNTIHRNQDKEPEKKEEELIEEKEEMNIGGIKIPISQQFDISLTQHLQRDIQKINMEQFSSFMQVNPSYEKTRRNFDQKGLNGMLLQIIPLDKNLELSLNERRQSRKQLLFTNNEFEEDFEGNQTLQIFKQGQNIRREVLTTLKRQFISAVGYEQSWRKIRSGDFEFEKANNDRNENGDIMIDQGQELKYKKVQEAVKLKKKGRNLQNYKQIEQDGLNWLSQKDKIMLGLKTSKQQAGQTIKKAQKNEDDIEFNCAVLDRKSVFREDTMQKQKNQFHEEIQEKHLLPLRPIHQFKVNQIMSLRYQPPANLVTELAQQPQNFEKMKENEQVDVRRQQISIRQSKEKIKQLLATEKTFTGLYKKMEGDQKNMTAQLCFLTLLHLANENNLSFSQSDNSNFKIMS